MVSTWNWNSNDMVYVWNLEWNLKIGIGIAMECRIIYGCIKSEFGNWILNQGFSIKKM